MSGHRNFKELVAKMSPKRRARVKAEADELFFIKFGVVRSVVRKEKNLFSLASQTFYQRDSFWEHLFSEVYSSVHIEYEQLFGL